MIVVLCIASVIGHVQAQSLSVQPGVKWTHEDIKKYVAPMRAGRKLTPKIWPNGAKIAVCLSWDMENDVAELATGNTGPISLSNGEYGNDALPRIMELYDRYRIPGSFYIPAVTAMIYPELVAEIRKRPQHEIGVHGWIHENLIALNDQAEEERLLRQTMDFWTKTLGKKPVGYRAPYWAFSRYTLDIISKEGFLYDSSAMSMDEPYEIVSNGRPTGLIELPVSLILDDAPYLWWPGAALPSPELAFKVYQDEFDVAYKDGTFFMLTMHPMITGRRSRLMYLDRLIAYMKTKPGVWFATGQDIAEYVKEQHYKSSQSE